MVRNITTLCTNQAIIRYYINLNMAQSRTFRVFGNQTNITVACFPIEYFIDYEEFK